MKFVKFNICGHDGKSNCVVRSLCKILNKDYDQVYNDLVKYANDLKCSSFNDIEVFEKYMEDNGIIKINYGEDSRVKELKLDKESYIIFCYDKKDYYHMISLIDGVIYDKNSNCMDLYIISIYRKK